METECPGKTKPSGYSLDLGGQEGIKNIFLSPGAVFPIFFAIFFPHPTFFSFDPPMIFKYFLVLLVVSVDWTRSMDLKGKSDEDLLKEFYENEKARKSVKGKRDAAMTMFLPASTISGGASVPFGVYKLWRGFSDCRVMKRKSLEYLTEMERRGLQIDTGYLDNLKKLYAVSLAAGCAFAGACFGLDELIEPFIGDIIPDTIVKLLDLPLPDIPGSPKEAEDLNLGEFVGKVVEDQVVGSVTQPLEQPVANAALMMSQVGTPNRANDVRSNEKASRAVDYDDTAHQSCMNDKKAEKRKEKIQRRVDRKSRRGIEKRKNLVLATIGLFLVGAVILGIISEPGVSTSLIPQGPRNLNLYLKQ